MREIEGLSRQRRRTLALSAARQALSSVEVEFFIKFGRDTPEEWAFTLATVRSATEKIDRLLSPSPSHRRPE